VGGFSGIRQVLLRDGASRRNRPGSLHQELADNSLQAARVGPGGDLADQGRVQPSPLRFFQGNPGRQPAAHDNQVQPQSGRASRKRFRS
jgi:hypothetical protein